MIDSASILLVFTFHCVSNVSREKKGMEKHFTFMFLLKFTTCKLQYCELLGLEKKTGEGRLSSDKASKIMQLHCNFTFSTNSMCMYSWLQPPFSLSAVLVPVGIQFTCTGFCKKMTTHSIYTPC